jgi:thioredoxin-related protein
MLDSTAVGHGTDYLPHDQSSTARPDFGDVLHQSPFDQVIVGDNTRQIEWAKSLSDGIAQAQREGKPVVCVFEEDSCGWCKKFDQELTKPEAVDLAKNAIFVRINPSKDPDGSALAANLGIHSYPTVSILDINGTNISERTRMTGYMTAGDFASHFGSHESDLA